MATTNTNMDSVHHALKDSPQNWGLSLFLGVLLIILGILALWYTIFTSAFTIALLGWLLIIGGAVKFFSLFFIQSGRMTAAMLGILYFIIGLIVVSNPGITLLTLTLLLAIAWTVGGLVQLFAAMFSAKNEGHRGWGIFGGLVTLILGVLVWMGWPVSSLYIVGLFVGIELCVAGVALSTIALETKRLQSPNQ